ncbi:hypothetical protein L1987_70538 [Smallanthus sonchifolius]|uniref:Uncharacterized protein n=1 Tax=Smallanthus sonchifolius TaxID=185202 RepID=A0ACB9AP48_9ASTR|nr:hypothetical protein L1987_70538 [Smallanthus sonchifolius]
MLTPKFLFADVGGYALDFHHGFVIQYGCNRDIELGICHLFILILFTLPKFIDIVVSRAPFYMNVSCRFANLSWKHQGGASISLTYIASERIIPGYFSSVLNLNSLYDHKDLLAIANRDALEEPFDYAINRSASGGGGVAVAAVGCGIEPATVAAAESKKE